jgi:hypothetical protein
MDNAEGSRNKFTTAPLVVSLTAFNRKSTLKFVQSNTASEDPSMEGAIRPSLPIQVAASI